MTVGGYRLPGVALVADPGVAIVVVPVGPGPLRKAHGGSGHHAALGARQSTEDGHGHFGISRTEDMAPRSGTAKAHMASVADQHAPGSGALPSRGTSLSSSTRSST